MSILNLTDQDSETAMFIAFGAISVCWEHPEKAGVFQSDRAVLIGEELMDHLRKLRLLP